MIIIGTAFYSIIAKTTIKSIIPVITKKSIIPKLNALIPESDFIERFGAKGRMRPLLESISLSIVMNDRAALQGAASYAARRARGDRG